MNTLAPGIVLGKTVATCGGWPGAGFLERELECGLELLARAWERGGRVNTAPLALGTVFALLLFTQTLPAAFLTWLETLVAFPPFAADEANSVSVHGHGLVVSLAEFLGLIFTGTSSHDVQVPPNDALTWCEALSLKFTEPYYVTFPLTPRPEKCSISDMKLYVRQYYLYELT